jgi:hypothetical protein
VPPAVPLIYDARLALARLWQVYRRWIEAPALDYGYRWRSQPMPAVVKQLAEDCRIMIGPWPGRVVTRCPSCRMEVYLLRGTPDGWECRWCHGQRWDQLEVSLGAYAMGLRIGLGGRPMVQRRHRLMRAVARLAMRAQAARDLWLLAAGSALIGYSPHWRRYHPRAGEAGRRGKATTLLRVVGPDYLPSLIDTLLHPDAFHGRFATVSDMGVFSLRAQQGP